MAHTEQHVYTHREADPETGLVDMRDVGQVREYVYRSTDDGL